MADLEAVLDEAGLTNPRVREFVKEYAELTGAERVEVVNASDDARLLEEAVAAGELQRAGEGRYYSRSYYKDTARSEERTIVATNDEKDRGVYNNWRPASEMKPMLHERMRGASEGKTMYVIPYLMAPAGNALAPWAAGVELTDTRTVVLHMIRMARVGVQFVNDLEDPDSFVRAVHVTGDLEHLGQGTPDDQRYFVTVADERTILHFGSSYGGNALLGKIAHGLRQGAYDGWASKKFLAEQYMLIGIHDKETGRTYHVCGGFPSASGKTNLAMMAAPDALGDRYHVSFYGDDIAWLWVDEETGRLMGMNPEYGVFGVAKDTNEKTNPNALASIDEGTQAIFTNVAYNPTTGEVWWEGKTPEAADRRQRLARLDRRAARGPQGQRHRGLGAPQQPLHHHARQRAQHRARLRRSRRRADRRDHLRRPHPRPRAADPGDHRPRRGRLRRPHARRRGDLRRRGRRRPAALRPDVQPAVHGLRRGRLRPALPRHRRGGLGPADLRPRQLVPEGPRRRPLPVARLPRQPAPAAVAAPAAATARSRDGVRPSASCRPRRSSTSPGMDVPAADLERILSIDHERWQQEMGFREEHLSQFDRMPEEIWEAHRRVAADLDAEG